MIEIVITIEEKILYLIDGSSKFEEKREIM